MPNGNGNNGGGNNKKYLKQIKYGIVSDITRDSIEITEHKRAENWKPKKTQWWIEWPMPAQNMPIGTRVSYIEVKVKHYPDFIRSVEKYD